MSVLADMDPDLLAVLVVLGWGGWMSCLVLLVVACRLLLTSIANTDEALEILRIVRTLQDREEP